MPLTSSSLFLTFSVLVASLVGARAASPARASAVRHAVVQSHRVKPGCGPLSLIAHGRGAARNPGAGMDPASFTREESFMDGFYQVTCAKDYMHEHGDKFGDGKFAYELGERSNVSIVHYTEVVPKEEQKAMTHAVCFGFCRTVPDMRNFGITNGRDCYCMPYFDQVPGDSSDCDAVCDGAPTTMCGGKTKSMIFEMHSCDDAAANLEDASSSAETAAEKLGELVAKIDGASEAMQDSAETLQGSFGKVGDSAATTLFQDAKVFAGTLVHAGEDGQAHIDTIDALMKEAGALSPEAPDQDSEKITADLSAAIAKAAKITEKLAALDAKASPPEPSKDDANSADLYYPVMYFVDKSFVDVPATCGGKRAADPAVTSYEGCAAACNAAVGRCVGFDYFGSRSGGLCFLFSELTSATYYTGCAAASTKFLEVAAARTSAASDTRCSVKFAQFEGTTLAPNPSGKCKQCLKEAKKADRCFE